MILKSKEQVIVVFVRAQIAPHTEDRIAGEYLLIWRHGVFGVSVSLVTLLGENSETMHRNADVEETW